MVEQEKAMEEQRQVRIWNILKSTHIPQLQIQHIWENETSPHPQLQLQHMWENETIRPKTTSENNCGLRRIKILRCFVVSQQTEQNSKIGSYHSLVEGHTSYHKSGRAGAPVAR